MAEPSEPIKQAIDEQIVTAIPDPAEQLKKVSRKDVEALRKHLTCPAFPEIYSPHQWQPIAAESRDRAVLSERRGWTIDVIEVCPSCVQYRTRRYSPVPRDSDGVHSDT